MKRANEHLAGFAPHQLFGALAHFAGGFVGEGDGGNAVGCQARLNEAANLVRDHPRFARPGASQHQTRPAQVVHGVKLGEVQAGGVG